MTKKLKFGIVAPLPGVEVKDLIKFCIGCESGGFDSVWFPDHVLFMANKLTPEAWSVITAAAAVTKKIDLGAIGDPHRMHPSTLAHRLATVDHISNGRIFSCLGYGEKMNLEYYGIKWNKPLKRLRETVEIMRNLWRGEVVNYKGEFFNLEDAEIRINPVVGGEVPIYIAATGPNSLKLAGEIGNGWITNAMPTWVYSEKYSVVNETLKINVNKSATFETAIYLFLSVAKDKDIAYQTLDNIKHAIIWPDVIEEAGYSLNISDEYKGLSYTRVMPNDREMLIKLREMGEKYYTREILSDFTLYGTAGDIIERLNEYIDVGVNHFILRDFSPDKEHSFGVLSKDIIPHFS